MGVGQQAPVAANQGDMGITPPLIRQYGEILRQYSRLQLMPHSRVNYKVYMWAKNKRSIKKRGWVGRVEIIWDDTDVGEWSPHRHMWRRKQNIYNVNIKK